MTILYGVRANVSVFYLRFASRLGMIWTGGQENVYQRTIISERQRRTKVLKLDINIEAIRFDGATYLRDFDRAMTKAVKEAAREWLIAVLNTINNAPHTSGDSFPVQTGEAKGSLLPLATALNRSQISVSVPVSPAEGRKDRSAEGRRQGHVELPPPADGRGLRYNFSFSTDVVHFQVNEITGNPRFPSTVPDGWHVFEAGREAFINYMDKNVFGMLPRLTDFIFVER